jgi:diketogulonate reductase-like aldo/keto reductase
MRSDLVEKFVTKSLKDLQTDYIDLYLIHWPIGMAFQGEDVRIPVGQDGKTCLYDTNTDLVRIWKAMEQQVTEGRIKAIGLSNFNAEQIERIIKIAKILPANLQVVNFKI